MVPAQAIAEMQKNGAGFAGFATWLDMTPADADMFAIPDPDSLIQLPWKKEVGWLASDLWMNGKPVAASPRVILKKQIKKLLNNDKYIKIVVKILNNYEEKIEFSLLYPLFDKYINFNILVFNFNLDLNKLYRLKNIYIKMRSCGLGGWVVERVSQSYRRTDRTWVGGGEVGD